MDHDWQVIIVLRVFQCGDFHTCMHTHYPSWEDTKYNFEFFTFLLLLVTRFAVLYITVFAVCSYTGAKIPQLV